MDSDNQTKNSRPFKKPGWHCLILGVLYPLGVILFEFISGFCASALFNPIPTLWHLLLLLLVPTMNGYLFVLSRREAPHKYQPGDGCIRIAAGLAVSVNVAYVVLFLPLLPASAIAIAFYGLGLLPLSPFVALFYSIWLYRKWTKSGKSGKPGKYEKSGKSRATRPAKGYGLGIILGITAMLLLDVPPALTHLGMNWASADEVKTQQHGIQLLRVIGDKDLILKQCYNGSREIVGPLSFSAIMLGESSHRGSPEKAREIFYRVFGEPFNFHPVPHTHHRWTRFDGFRFDRDQGGTQVGERLKDLNLISSVMDASVSPEDGLAYIEWTLEFQNNAWLDQETRAQFLLPPNSFVTRATLWVNGEEREAAYARESKARAAYQSVVQRQRDPLLVTYQGADRILAQAFPIPSNGGTLKYKLGITAPATILEGRPQNTSQWLLPIIINRNFNIENNLTHNVWVESPNPMMTSFEKLNSTPVSDNRHRLSLSLNDMQLTEPRIKIFTHATPALNTPRLSRAFANNPYLIQQVLTTHKPAKKSALMIVVDGSKPAKQHRKDIIKALNQLPETIKVGLAIAGDKLQFIEPKIWDTNQKEAIIQALKNFSFVGGQDNIPTLYQAQLALDGFENSEILWLHAPQPIRFYQSSSLLEQAGKRLQNITPIVSYPLNYGPNKILDIERIALHTSTLPRIDDTEKDLKQYFKKISGLAQQWQFIRTQIKDEPSKNSLTQGSNHIARLWAGNEVRRLLQHEGEAMQEKALEIAIAHRIVSPVSGAVVLENAQQYAANNLEPVDSQSVPTIPEPHQWVLAFCLLFMIVWLIRNHRKHYSITA